MMVPVTLVCYICVCEREYGLKDWPYKSMVNREIKEQGAQPRCIDCFIYSLMRLLLRKARCCSTAFHGESLFCLGAHSRATALVQI